MLVDSAGSLGIVGLGGASGFIFSQQCEDESSNNSQFNNNKKFIQVCTNQTFNNSSCSLCKYKVNKCNVRNCKTCSIFNENHTFISTVTGRKYHTSIGEDVTCSSTNLVYLLQCNYCKLQYVGQTCQTLRERMGGHRSGICNDQESKIFYEHFTRGLCQGYGFSVQIIQKLTGNGRVPIGDGVEAVSKKGRGVRDVECTARREGCETDWMVELRSIYPYGLNDRCKGKDWRERGQGELVGANLFKKLGHFIPNQVRGKKGFRPGVSPEDGLTSIHESCGCYGPDSISCASCVLNGARILVNSMKKVQGKKLGSLISDLIYKGEGKNSFLMQYYDAILDMIDSKFSKGSHQQSASRQKPNVLFPIFFSSKLIQDLGLSRMFRETSILEALPMNTIVKVPTIVYRLGKTVRGKLFNYRQALANLDVDHFIANYDNMVCECKNSKYTDPHHKHIITGNLSIVEHDLLRKLMQEGPNFREQPHILSPKPILNGVKRDINQGIENWAKFEGVPIEAFGEWRVKCLENLKKSLNKIFYQKNKRVTGEVLKRRDVIEYLTSFHSKFIITSIDKTTSNLGVVCKKFYIKNILEECGLWPGGGSETYEVSNQNKQGIINKLKQGVSLFGVKQSGDHHDDLPYIYSIIKMHKNPVKFRYIISSRQCTTKPLAKAAMLGLKECQKQNKAYCTAIKQYTGINMFFITDNFQKIASDIQYLNGRSKANSISTYDFTSLYTKIQHKHLITNLEWYIDLAFKGANKRGKKFLSVYSKSANWVVKHHEKTCAFDPNTFKALNKFLINNAYFSCGDKILRQKIGIPMGLDPAPQMANAHLHKYEFDFQQKMAKTNYSVARSLNHTFRYIDDISPLNDKGNFEK